MLQNLILIIVYKLLATSTVHTFVDATLTLTTVVYSKSKPTSVCPILQNNYMNVVPYMSYINIHVEMCTKRPDL